MAEVKENKELSNPLILIKELAAIFDLADPRKEATKKLVGTWVFVNGELTYIGGFDFERGVIYGDKDKKYNVKTLSPWLPESGIYPLPCGGFCLVEKQPKRQWLKSFSNSFYIVKIQKSFYQYKRPEDIYPLISKQKKQEIYTDKSKEIFYLDKYIGRVEDSRRIICTNNLFKQELYDWSRTCQ